ncbi:actin cytoskeleton protein [Niveomyces insectorum RCEF 264]|uniref:Actin cytoskeleton protein n=1 Tax=Niveomyces insectorum RCEF 264 TaxID=1081102 RepID=A0A167M1C0_9HYPO|nr:actin cytoskeleton protein [Niveomyces insectorum RCEF 264]
MSNLNTVHVNNIAAATSDKEVKDFFSFCGKITDIQIAPEGETKTATVTFEKDTAAKTALLLNNTQLGPNHLAVTGAAQPEEPPRQQSPGGGDKAELSQEEKPRARIFAEYLAHGYVIGDAALQRAIELDHQHGVSTRFVNTLHQLDGKYHATDRARSADQSYGISSHANTLLTGLGSYFEKAANTPTGQRLVGFYTQGQRQVQDIHQEARRLAELKKQAHGGSAYKAAGLDRFFGEHKDAPTTGGAGASAGPTTAATPAGAPATGATSSTAASTETPKFDPPPTAPVS